jgi:hypothetical protein
MIPDSQSIMLPYLNLISDRKEWSFQDIVDRLGHQFKVSHDERQEMIPSGQKTFDYRVGFSRTIFKRVGFIESSRNGYVMITNKGLEFLSKNPDSIKFKLLRSHTKNDFVKSLIKPQNIMSQKQRKINTIDKFSYIKALGNLLTYYKSDLEYIRNFQFFKKGLVKPENYVLKAPGTFKAFLNEFRIARNIDKTKTSQLLELTNDWITGQYPENVDAFAEYLKMSNITRDKTMTSLASKILFLNNPWMITPLDSRAKQTLGLRTNFYSEYLPLVQDFIFKNRSEIQFYLDSLSQHLTSIEACFQNDLPDLLQIRLNRYVDKILWTNERD